MRVILIFIKQYIAETVIILNANTSLDNDSE